MQSRMNLPDRLLAEQGRPQKPPFCETERPKLAPRPSPRTVSLASQAAIFMGLQRALPREGFGLLCQFDRTAQSEAPVGTTPHLK
jgi:hypothetical protein